MLCWDLLWWDLLWEDAGATDEEVDLGPGPRVMDDGQPVTMTGFFGT